MKNTTDYILTIHGITPSHKYRSAYELAADAAARLAAEYGRAVLCTPVGESDEDYCEFTVRP